MHTYIKDTHSFARPNEVIMSHLDLTIQVDFQEKIIAGRASLRLDTSHSGEALYLDTKNLDIEKVQLDREEGLTEFQLAPPVEHLGQALEIKIKPHTEWVHIHYQTRPKAQALQWLAAEQTAGKQYPFLFTQSQAILARSWIPCQDSPGIRFTYHADVEVPTGLLALMSARNPSRKNQKGHYEFDMPQPVPAYLLALAVGDLEFAPLDERSGLYAEPVTMPQAIHEFEELPRMVKAAEALYGPYRWEQYDLLVLPPSFPFGGMENPRVTFVTPTILAGDRSLTSLIAHELAHSWSGNLVTNATWNDFWLNEGFTVYFERRIMEALQGVEYAEMLTYLGFQDLQHTLNRLGRSNPDTKLKLDLEGRDPDEGVTDIAYEKGFFMLRTLEEEIGREKMDAFLRRYFEHHAFQSIHTEAFLDYLAEHLPEAEAIHPKKWIYETGLPENCYSVRSLRFEKVEQALEEWLAWKPATSLDTDPWSGHEWLFFIRSLPRNLSKKQLADLDHTFQFTQSGNSEILAAWFELALVNDYPEVLPAVEQFLTRVGRRKFLRPVYKALLSKEDTRAKAREIYNQARPNYHYVSTHSLDETFAKAVMKENLD